jgi:membrane-bound ClpP family serine protease
MQNWLLVLYLINATLLIVHEIDSAYWQEWKLFKMPGGPALFLFLHIPLVLTVLLGLVLLVWGATAGLVISGILGLAGIFAFIIHMSFIARGRQEFKTASSISVLWATLIFSLLQLALTVYTLSAGKL